MKNHAGAFAAGALALALVAGCAGDTGRDETAAVSGRVTYAGEPVPEGRVIFYPADGRRMAFGSIDASGNYTLTTFDPGDGAFLGRHTVVIDATRQTTADPASFDEEFATGDPEFVRLVPAEYAQQSTTTLERVVEAGDNTIDFDLPE